MDEGAELTYTIELLCTFCQTASREKQALSIALQLVSYKPWLVKLLPGLAEILATQQLNPVAKLVPCSRS